ncbi:MAG: 4-hydroxy-tetrahydrodipicolinate synthase [Phycisphaerae bacterium]|nr:4-hydroxy-tetrahydrodipicolinate synthase [Phycisphaerae bacterium]
MFKGCFVALVTPFRGGAIDRRALDELVDHVIAGGVDGLVPCGTTGESPTLSAEESEEAIAAVVRRSNGRVPVIAGTGANSTAKSLANSLAAVRAGADGVMLVAPYYNKPNQAGLYEHFSHVAKNVDVPIVLYNIPARTGVEIFPETIARLHDDYPKIAAVKHATGSIDGASELAALSDIAILSGDDTLTLPLISIGAVGVISVLANLLPREMSSLTGAALSGDFEAAGAWHRRLFPLARGMLRLDTNPIPIKTALAIRGMIAEEFRLPMCRLDAEKRRHLEALLAPSAAGHGPSADGRVASVEN